MGKVIVITTGGTIACQADETGGGFKPTLTGKKLLDTVPHIGGIVDFEIVNYSQIPGVDFSFGMLLELAKQVTEMLNRFDVDGVVISQGTDSLEEVAYFLELVVDSSKPVVLTGSMRTPDMPGFDGPANLYDSMILAGSEVAEGMGTAVVMNGKIHSAKFVTKANTTHPDAFQSSNGGIVGQVVENNVILFTRTCKAQAIPIIEKNVSKINVNVPLIKVCLEPGRELLEWLAQTADGIVIEAMGGGHVPSCLITSIAEASRNNIPVVITSRCGSGPLLTETYSFVGSEKSLRDAGAIFSNLSGLKARIKLITLLCAGSTRDTLGDSFAQD